jgi:hypothetical protein
MGAVVAYVVMLGVAVGVAVTLLFGLRAIKLI